MYRRGILFCAVVLAILGYSSTAPLQRTESLQKVEALKTKLSAFQTVLERFENDLASTSQDKRNLQDAHLDNFENSLSDSDKALIHKYPSYSQFLEKAKQAQANVAEEESTDKRQVDEDIESMVQHLSPADKSLLEANPSKLSLLQSALAAKKKSDVSAKQEDEVEALESVKSRLDALKESLNKQNQDRCEGQNCNERLAMSDNQAKCEGKDCDKRHKQEKCKGLDCIKQAAGSNEEKCEGSNCNKSPTVSHNEVKCEGKGCEKPPAMSHDQVITDVKAKLLKDLTFAKDHGVSANEILKTLREE